MRWKLSDSTKTPKLYVATARIGKYTFRGTISTNVRYSPFGEASLHPYFLRILISPYGGQLLRDCESVQEAKNVTNWVMNLLKQKAVLNKQLTAYGDSIRHLEV